MCHQLSLKPFWWGQVCVELIFWRKSIVVTAVLVLVFFTAVFITAVLRTTILAYVVLLVVLLIFHTILL